MAISRMQEPQQIQRGLGSLQDPRQNYGLGKLVKKALRGVKKIVKSPIGKAAIIGGLGMWGMGAGPFAGGKLGGGFLKGLMSKGTGGGIWNAIRGGAGKMAGGVGNWWGGLSGGQKLFTGLGAAAVAAPFFMGKDDEEEEVEESWTQLPSSIADIRNQARAHYTNPSASTLSFMPGKQFIKENFYAADGGRVGLLAGGEAGQEQIEQMLMAEYVKYKNQGGTLTFEQFVQAIMQQQQEQQGGGMEQPQELPQEGEVRYAANGGRIGFGKGSNLFTDFLAQLTSKKPEINIDPLNEAAATHSMIGQVPSGVVEEILKLNRQGKTYEEIAEITNLDIGSINNMLDLANYKETLEPIDTGNPDRNWDIENKMFRDINEFKNTPFRKKDGGRIGAYKGGLMSEDEDETTYNPYAATKMYRRIGKQEGGIMESEVAEEMIDMNGQEKDYRETGGFVNLGGKERADDVPARLSKNEFVFTADAVRAAGGGDIDAGSEVMQNMMDNLEQGGEISEESQGLEGAQAMYDQQQMLQSRIA